MPASGNSGWLSARTAAAACSPIRSQVSGPAARNAVEGPGAEQLGVEPGQVECRVTPARRGHPAPVRGDEAADGQVLGGGGHAGRGPGLSVPQRLSIGTYERSPAPE